MVPSGQLQLKTSQYASDFQPIDESCLCSTCKNYTRAYIHALVAAKETVGCHLVTIHNIAYQVYSYISLSGFNFDENVFSKFFYSNGNIFLIFLLFSDEEL